MKRFNYFLIGFLAFISLSVVSCKDDDKDDDSVIVGTWGTTQLMSSYTDDEGNVYIGQFNIADAVAFDASGNYSDYMIMTGTITSVNGNSVYMPFNQTINDAGTYTLVGTTLTQVSSTMGKSIVDVTFTGNNQMNVTDGGQTFVYDRK